MNLKDEKVLNGFAVAVCVGLFLVFKFLTPWVVSFLYENKFESFLQRITGPAAVPSLEFYQSSVEEVLSGPLSLLAANLAFVLISLRVLSQKPSWIFGLAVLVYLIVTKFEVLFFPPYGDAIGGPFSEAIWLSNNSFDYIGLAGQANFINGGPKIYLFSIYPTFLALGIKWVANTKIFLFANHIMAFGFGALTVVYVRKIFAFLYDRQTAGLVAALFLSLPLFHSQVEAINMEMPFVMFSTVALYFLVKREILTASIFSVLAISVKGIAVIVGATVFGMSVLLIIFDPKHRKNLATISGGVISIAVTVLALYANFFILNQDADVNMVGGLIGWFWIKRMFSFYFFLTAAAVFIGYSLFKGKRNAGGKSFLDSHFPVIAAFIGTAGWFALYINSFSDAHRYRLLLLPFLILGLFYVLMLVIRPRPVIKGILIGLIVLASVCSYGINFKLLNVDERKVVHNSKLERSLEYRNDLRLHRRLASLLEENFKGWTVGAPYSMAQMLVFPQLGYVDEKMDVVLYGYPNSFGDMKLFHGLKDLDLRRTIWVGLPTELPDHLKPMIEYPYGPYDKVIRQVAMGSRKGALFMGGASIEKMRLMMNIAYKKISHQ